MPTTMALRANSTVWDFYDASCEGSGVGSAKSWSGCWDWNLQPYIVKILISHREPITSRIIRGTGVAVMTAWRRVIELSIGDVDAAKLTSLLAQPARKPN